jgi:hypothetical protein
MRYRWLTRTAPTPLPTTHLPWPKRSRRRGRAEAAATRLGDSRRPRSSGPALGRAHRAEPETCAGDRRCVVARDRRERDHRQDVPSASPLSGVRRGVSLLEPVPLSSMRERSAVADRSRRASTLPRARDGLAQASWSRVEMAGSARRSAARSGDRARQRVGPRCRISRGRRDQHRERPCRTDDGVCHDRRHVEGTSDPSRLARRGRFRGGPPSSSRSRRRR